MAGLSRVELGVLRDAEDLDEFQTVNDELQAMRRVVRKVDKARTFELTGDTFDDISAIAKVLKRLDPGVYAAVEIDEDTPPDPGP